MGRPFTNPLCPNCGDTQRENFYTSTTGKRTNAYCKECHKKRCSDRYHSKSLFERRASRASQYGISKEEYIDLFTKQIGRCAICEEEPKTKRGLHIDHCHVTNRVRGLLCHGCNTAIGALRESKATMHRAILYLGDN
jgi:hypothetical protein